MTRYLPEITTAAPLFIPWTDPAAGTTPGIRCWRDRNQTARFSIRQRFVRHSPSGMEFGYGGSGPADFALNALATVTDPETAERFYQPFKWAVVASMPREGGVIPYAAIRAWVARQKEVAE